MVGFRNQVHYWPNHATGQMVTLITSCPDILVRFRRTKTRIVIRTMTRLVLNSTIKFIISPIRAARTTSSAQRNSSIRLLTIITNTGFRPQRVSRLVGIKGNQNLPFVAFRRPCTLTMTGSFSIIKAIFTFRRYYKYRLVATIPRRKPSQKHNRRVTVTIRRNIRVQSKVHFFPTRAAITIQLS